MVKFSSINYLLKSGVKNVWHNRLMSLATTFILIVCLFLTGSAYIVSQNINHILKSVESNNVIKVFLDESISALDAVQIGQQIKQIENVNMCEFVSKEETAQKIIKNLEKKKSSTTEFLAKSYKEDNNLPHSFDVSLTDLSQYDATIEKIKAVQGVSFISDISEVANKLTKLDHKIATVGVIAIAVLSVVSVFIMTMTIRITMFNRKLEIRIMKSVGATDMFVRTPFIVEGITIGVIAALLASGLLYLVLYISGGLNFVQKLIPLQTLQFSGVTWQMVLVFVAIGVLFGVMGGAISIRKYLRGRGGNIFDG